MKKVFLFIPILIASLLMGNKALACEIDFRIESDKTVFHANDELVITVLVELNHRRCEVHIEETMFTKNGIEILGATKWAQLSDHVYARKFKVKLNEGAQEAILRASRECEKDGASEELKIKIS